MPRKCASKTARQHQSLVKIAANLCHSRAENTGSNIACQVSEWFRLSVLRWRSALKFQTFRPNHGQRNSLCRKLEHAMNLTHFPKRSAVNAALAASVGLAIGGLSGCASILNDDTQELTVRVMCTGKAVQAYCQAENSKGSWAFNSPGKVVVSSDNRGLSITCKTQFSQPLTVTAPALPSWEMAGNILTGGLIGGAIDLYNNKGLRYPENIDISHSLCK